VEEARIGKAEEDVPEEYLEEVMRWLSNWLWGECDTDKDGMVEVPMMQAVTMNVMLRTRDGKAGKSTISGNETVKKVVVR
jgi:hypothetical protein